MRFSIPAALAAILLLAGPAAAHDYRLGNLVISHPWSRETPPGARVAGAYLTVTNKGESPDRLLGGSSPVSEGFELHAMQIVDGVMRMRALPEGVEIPAGETVALKPDGMHIMLTGLKHPISRDGPVTATLRFERAGSIRVRLAVEPLGARGPGEAHSHSPAKAQ